MSLFAPSEIEISWLFVSSRHRLYLVNNRSARFVAEANIKARAKQNYPAHEVKSDQKAKDFVRSMIHRAEEMRVTRHGF